MIAIWTALKSFGSWVANHPWVQAAIGALVFLIGLILWGERREQQGEDKQKVKQKERDLEIREDALDYIETVKEEGDEAAEQAIERRDTASPLDPERMPDDQRDRIFGRNRAPEGSG